jgi:hypothetical protein
MIFKSFKSLCSQFLLPVLLLVMVKIIKMLLFDDFLDPERDLDQKP